jgi:hypothetical protein
VFAAPSFVYQLPLYVIAGSFCSTRVCAKIEEELNASATKRKIERRRTRIIVVIPTAGPEAIGIRALGVEQAIFQSVLVI